MHQAANALHTHDTWGVLHLHLQLQAAHASNPCVAVSQIWRLSVPLMSSIKWCAPGILGVLGVLSLLRRSRAVGEETCPGPRRAAGPGGGLWLPAATRARYSVSTCSIASVGGRLLVAWSLFQLGACLQGHDIRKFPRPIILGSYEGHTIRGSCAALQCLLDLGVCCLQLASAQSSRCFCHKQDVAQVDMTARNCRCISKTLPAIPCAAYGRRWVEVLQATGQCCKSDVLDSLGST